MGITNARAETDRRQVIAAIRSGGTLGDVFYVNSSTTGAADTAGRGRTPNTPLNTIDFAVGLCADSNDDVIIVGSGHTETIIADSGIDVDVIGVTIIGMGRGAQRPTISFTTAVTADFKLAAANVRIENLLFQNGGIDILASPIEVSAAFCEIIDCEYQDLNESNIDAVGVIDVLAAADRVLIDGFVCIGTSDATVGCIAVADTAASPLIINCYITGDYSAGCIELLNTTDLVRIGHNLLINTNAVDVCISCGDTTCTGFIYDNLMEIATNGQVTSITVSNDCSLFDNFFVNNDGEGGLLQGTVST